MKLGGVVFFILSSTFLIPHSNKGGLTWQPAPKIIDALDAAFYATCKNVEGPPRLRAAAR